MNIGGFNDAVFNVTSACATSLRINCSAVPCMVMSIDDIRIEENR